jgi:hypothetical protein
VLAGVNKIKKVCGHIMYRLGLSFFLSLLLLNISFNILRYNQFTQDSIKNLVNEGMLSAFINGWWLSYSAESDVRYINLKCSLQIY